MILLLVQILTIIQMTNQSYGKVNKCCDEGEVFYQDSQTCGQVLVGKYFLSRSAYRCPFINSLGTVYSLTRHRKQTAAVRQSRW